MPHYTFDDFERAVTAGDAALASTIETYLLQDDYPADESSPHIDADESSPRIDADESSPHIDAAEEYADEMGELRKAALSRGQP